VAAAVGEVAELLDVHVHQLPGPLAQVGEARTDDGERLAFRWFSKRWLLDLPSIRPVDTRQGRALSPVPE
jgi:hypothetical protein